MKFSFATILVVLVSFAVAVDVSKLKEDLAAVDEAIENLDKHAQASSMSYFTALSISFAAQNLVGKIRTSSADIKALDSPISDADADDIITKLTATDGKVKPLVDDMIKIKPEWDKLGVMFIAAALVDEFQSQVKHLATQLVKACPNKQKERAQKLADSFNAQLDRCADSYDGDDSDAGTQGSIGTTGSDSTTGSDKTSQGQDKAAPQPAADPAAAAPAQQPADKKP